MAKPVSLNRYRKTKTRAEGKARADANTVKFGRSKVEKTRDQACNDKALRNLEGHKQDR